MFKKRLKGLLAMVLAGSIALTALPLTASASIIGDITVYNGETSKKLNYANFHSDTLVSGNLNSNSLWGVYYRYKTYDSGTVITESDTRVKSVSGDMLEKEIDHLDSPPYTYYSDIKIRAQHKYIVTTEGPVDSNISTNSVKTTSVFPLEISLSEYGFTASPLIDHYSCTAWYGVPGFNSNIVDHSSLVESTVKSVTSSADSEKITVGMEAFAGLYSEELDTVAEDRAKDIFENGITILQLNPEYKTYDIPVRNAVLQPEKESDNSNKTVTVRKDNEDWLDEKDDPFYLCYMNVGPQITVKISSSEMTTENAVWDEIAAWATEIENFDTSKLFLCRNVIANVCGNGVNSQFNAKDVFDYLIINRGKETEDTNEALVALYKAKPKSIWKVSCFDSSIPSFYTYQSDALNLISDYLLEYPHERVLTLTELGSIKVTAVDPNTNKVIEDNSYIESKLLDEKGEPRTISDYFNDLLNAVPQEAGKKYDTDGWQFWEAVVSSGGISDFSQIELDEKPDSIGVTELNKMKKDKVLVYFPMVDIAPSLEVTAPVAGETPSTEYKIVDKVGGYSVISVEWSCDNNLLGPNDKFKAGKKYTVRFELSADVNLLFVDSTPVTINGEKARTSYEEIVGFYAYRSFTTAPEKPANVKATAGDGKVDLSWEEGEGAFYYSVYLYNEDGTLRQIATIEDLSHDLSYTVENLANGTEYGFLIRAVSEAGVESSYTAEDVVYATPSAPVDPKPQNVKATPGNGKVTLTWDKVTGATNYLVYTYTAEEGYKNRGTTTSTSKVVTGLTNGTKYAFLVKAYFNGKWSTFTTADFVYATPVSATNKPQNVKAVAGNGQVTLTWDKVTNATNYLVYTYTAEEGYKNRGTTTGTSKVVTGLTNGTKYAFLVKAYVNGAWSTFTTADFVYATPNDTAVDSSEE